MVPWQTGDSSSEGLEMVGNGIRLWSSVEFEAFEAFDLYLVGSTHRCLDF